MFDRTEATELDDALAAEYRERTWLKLHDEIKDVRKQCTSLEAREVELLFEAEETMLYKRFGYTSIHAYIHGELGYSYHTATERMRVAHELLDLPGIREEFHAGELPWTSVRELTRVVTPKTEEVWLDAVEGKRVDEVQQMVRGKRKGDLPSTPVDPKKIKYRIVFEDVSAEEYALYKQARIAAAEALGGTCTDDQYIGRSSRNELEPVTAPNEPSRPRYQSSITTCRECKKGHVVAAGIEAELSAQALERVQCDTEHIGDLERDEPTRLTSEIPEPTRRKVFVRDKFQCAVPGCGACRFLEIHHVKRRSEGGGHQLWNLLLLCDGHHTLLHDGVLAIRGRAPDALEFDLPFSPGRD